MNHSRPIDAWPRPMAFALSGGGSWGASQVGMLSALHEAGIVPDLIVGTSVGALNGAVLAAQPDRAVEQLTEVWLEMDQATIFGGTKLHAAITFLRTRGANLSRPDGLMELIEAHCPVDRLEDLAIPLTAVLTDALTGDVRLIDQGPLHDALMATAAIPGVFPAVTLDGRRYVDGGVVANIPIRPALRQGAGTVVVLDATPEQLTARSPRRPVGQLLNTVSLMLRSQAAADVENLPADRIVIQLPKATPDGYGSFDFSRSADLIARGYRVTIDALA